MQSSTPANLVARSNLPFFVSVILIGVLKKLNKRCVAEKERLQSRKKRFHGSVSTFSLASSLINCI